MRGNCGGLVLCSLPHREPGAARERPNGRDDGQGDAVTAALPVRAGVHRLHNPLCVFLIAYGATKLAELLDWPHLHDDVMAMLGFGPGAVTGLLLAGKGVELLLIGTAVLSIVRVSRFWLLATIAGWTTDLVVLSVVAAACGDLGRLLDHGLSLLAFAALLVATYVLGAERPSPPAPAAPAPDAPAPDADVTRQDLPARGTDVTRQDLPVRKTDVTRQDVRTADVTRQDLPVRGRRAWPPEDRER